MTDCIHNDKRTCLHERMEMVQEIAALKAEIDEYEYSRNGDVAEIAALNQFLDELRIADGNQAGLLIEQLQEGKIFGKAISG